LAWFESDVGIANGEPAIGKIAIKLKQPILERSVEIRTLSKIKTSIHRQSFLISTTLRNPFQSTYLTATAAGTTQPM